MAETNKATLLAKIKNRSACVAIIGLGYVGLPLAVAFAEAGFPVIGIDVDASKVDAINAINAINAGHSYISDISSARLAAVTGDRMTGLLAQSPVPNPQSPIPSPISSLLPTTPSSRLVTPPSSACPHP